MAFFRGLTEWEVRAEWLGRVRPVFQGTLWECFEYVRTLERGN